MWKLGTMVPSSRVVMGMVRPRKASLVAKIWKRKRENGGERRSGKGSKAW